MDLLRLDIFEIVTVESVIVESVIGVQGTTIMIVTIDSWQLIGHRQQKYGKFTNLPSYDDRLMIDDHS